MAYRLNQLLQHDACVFFAENQMPINHFEYERPEQLQAYTHVRPDFCVLELGARYGLISCLVNRLLSNPKKHVVVEPDAAVIPALERNRNFMPSAFSIHQGIVAPKTDECAKLVQLGSASYVAYHDAQQTNDKQDEGIEICTFEELQTNVGMTFDCLIADCEGGLEKFLSTVENVAQFKLIMFERDYPDKCDYQAIHHQLLQAGFLCLSEKFHSCYINMNDLPFTVQPNFSCAFGTVGLNGSRGVIYDIPGPVPRQTSDVAVPHHVLQFAAENDYQLHTICAHADSSITIVPKVELMIVGFIQGDIIPNVLHKDAEYTWTCNQDLVNKCCASDLQQAHDPDMSAITTLTPGKPYTLKIVAKSPYGIQHAHTAWAVFEKNL